MSEEEIETELLNCYDSDISISKKCIDEIIIKLDLYEQQKEIYEQQKEILVRRTIDVDILEEMLIKLKQERNELDEQNFKLQKENEEYKTASNFSEAQLEYIKKYYIDKDKIKAKIKEFQNKECEDMQTILIKHLIIEMLEELLGE